MKSIIIKYLLTFILADTFSIIQSQDVIGTWHIIHYKRYEKDSLVSDKKIRSKSKIYIHNDGTIGYRYVHYRWPIPHTSRRPVTNRWKRTDSSIFVFWEQPHRFIKSTGEEKPLEKLIINKLTADTLILIFRDAYVRVYCTYVRVK